MAAKIKHLVFNTTDPERLADFYVKVMGLKVTHRARNGGISLTDGYLNLSIHNNKMDGKVSGFNHFGFEVDDNEKHVKLAKKHGYVAPEKRPGDRHYTEYRGMDPDGNNFDLSTNGYDQIRPDRVVPLHVTRFNATTKKKASARKTAAKRPARKRARG